MKNLALINGRVIDGTGCPVTFPATVLVKGTVLTAVGPTTDISVPEECSVIYLQGRTVLPGL
ncbi:MAG: hypothetical protein PHT33_11415, partial [bacterium]|nr:hypothetical protein [bacterium]